ncbi:MULTISPECIES: NAD(P)-binding domain-containing protein [unclassified Rathayibacter]|uniref:NAD(P)-binding domain-containing protein n=1 Tax=unclassified Rathayibacter TaxID=2609250 RepID=UPI0012E86A3B
MTTIAVIGTGRVGAGFAEAAVAVGHSVVLANSRSSGRSRPGRPRVTPRSPPPSRGRPCARR